MGYSLTLESIILITCSEFNIWKEKGRRYNHRTVRSDSDIEKLADTPFRSVECVGSVVGYREDPTIFRNCLDSYAENYDHCMRVLVIGIDGNEMEDLSMIEVAEEVFGEDLVKIDLPRTFGALAKDLIAQQCAESRPLLSEKGSALREAPRKAIDYGKVLGELVTKASDILREHDVLYAGPEKFTPICLNQPHHSKKEIMFTVFIFSLALCRTRSIPFIWSSDSDSWIFPDTLARAISGIANDESFGGSCTQLEIHNSTAAFISYMAAATYWSEIHLTSGILSSVDAIDCMPGPCALFRCEALEDILLEWYDQRVFGRRPTVNEDRHLTTRLLLSRWKISFSPQAIVATDAPTTFAAYTTQQLRWSRATILESLYYPLVYVRHSPVLFLASMRRLLVPIGCIYAVSNYLWIGDGTYFSSVRDIFFRILLCAAYTFLRHRGKLSWFAIQLIAQPLWFILRAGFTLWSFVTVFDNSWGTFKGPEVIESSGESKKSTKILSGSQFATSVWLGLVAAAISKYVARTYFVQNEYYMTLLGFFGTLITIIAIYAKENRG
ncbi:hypothetical protein BS50DRAFT_507151 [Corynespora cassiicola Philippines]|uniref:Glycosyltransferase 2-like domain-containing protein n=1 Tax=Corynespora cassiicola Philippines TaxID=1448308 RepID=A0A2T2N3D7_CORCC|nr:hypothetical protein BS50DRAFT_507151 [Corynespora cassiicola Philippines]